jgi:hypothetical protein
MDRVKLLSTLGAVAIVGGTFAGVLLAQYRETNLARSAELRTSAHLRETPPSLAVDGVRYGDAMYRSKPGPSGWFLLDFGKATPVQRIEVYGQKDCTHDPAVWFSLDVSPDCKKYRSLGRRFEAVNQCNPWISYLDAEPVKCVKLRAERGQLTLSELEVWGD